MITKSMYAVSVLLCALALAGGIHTRRWRDVYRSLLLLGCSSVLCAEAASIRGVVWDLPVTSVLTLLAFIVLIRYREDAETN